MFSVKKRLIVAFRSQALAKDLVLAEYQRNTPDRRQSHYGIEDTADDAAASESPGDEVKAENAYQAPVKTADDEYPKTYFIHHLKSSLSFKFLYHNQIYSGRAVIVRKTSRIM